MSARTITYYCPSCRDKVVGYDPAKACADCVTVRELISDVGDWDDQTAHDVVMMLSANGFAIIRKDRLP